MLRLAIPFFVIALIAGFFGFPFVADYSWLGAKIVFCIFLGLTMVFFVGGTFRMWSDRTTELPVVTGGTKTGRAFLSEGDRT